MDSTLSPVGAVDSFCEELCRRLEDLRQNQESPDYSSCHPEPWWPFPDSSRSSSLDIHTHRLSRDFDQPMRRHYGNGLPCLQKSGACAQTRRGIDTGGKEAWDAEVLNPEPQPAYPIEQTGYMAMAHTQSRTHRRRSSCPNPRKRMTGTTHYDEFTGESFEKRRPTVPSKRRPSLLSSSLMNIRDSEVLDTRPDAMDQCGPVTGSYIQGMEENQMMPSADKIHRGAGRSAAAARAYDFENETAVF
ncbi:hypothetical protein EJ06DRAFT_533166 [Trichodelitschia bisporula]|uniref:Uncharacterized protein n=1 Tax=Trichodelitschia bisporula TaxID=703511 RepID=A0A6G1HNJ1_9PEZI|nr:hypothetical protein EJ06DRAFT_533166 [Trichodelitschia bisporula]